jgi:hypothetical protein
MTPPSNIALRIVIEEDSKLVRRLNTNYANAAPDGGLENGERDALCDVLALHFTGRPWPRSCEINKTRQFMVTLQRAMVAVGWKVDFFAVMA